MNWPLVPQQVVTGILNGGIIGLIAYLMLWSVIYWQTWRATRRARGLLRGLAIGLLGAWTHLSVHHLLDNLYVNNVHLHIGVMLGFLAFVVQQTDYDSKAQNTHSD